MWCYKNSVKIVLIQFLVLLMICFTNAQHSELDCDKSDQPIACRSSQLINNIVSHIVSRNGDDETLKILPGIEIIQNEQTNTVNSNERSMHNGVKENDTILSRVTRYLQTHDLKVKFSDLVGKADLQDAVNTFFGDNNQPMAEGRKKDKGGGYMLMSALMMGKMMAALGFGGIGMLALKALGVSMLALMLSAIIGLKKLSEGGGDSGHHVQYVTSDHRRKRRDLKQEEFDENVIPLPYRGWTSKND